MVQSNGVDSEINSIQLIEDLDGWHTSKEDVRMTLNGAKEALCIGGIPVGTFSIDSTTSIISFYKLLNACFDNCSVNEGIWRVDHRGVALCYLRSSVTVTTLSYSCIALYSRVYSPCIRLFTMVQRRSTRKQPNFFMDTHERNKHEKIMATVDAMY